MNGLKHVRPGGGFEPRFPLSKKIEVNGKNEDPLFTFLKVRSETCANDGGYQTDLGPLLIV